MELEKQVLELLDFIKNKMEKMNLDANDVFLNGNCGNLYEIFTRKFSKYTTPYLITYRDMPYHIVTKIGKKMYDITGETDLDSYIKYIQERNPRYGYKESDFQIKQLSVADNLLRKMKNMYRYNEDFGQSEIDSQMDQLLRSINGLDLDR